MSLIFICRENVDKDASVLGKFPETLNFTDTILDKPTESKNKKETKKKKTPKRLVKGRRKK